MHVSVFGLRNDKVEASRTWSLVATHGDGPYVPTLAAAALVRRLSAGDAQLAGAMPCVGSLALEDFEKEARGLNIQTTEVVA